jgi:hypothetical protein
MKTKALIRHLEEALASARLGKTCGVRPDAQVEMRLYLQTWVAARIAAALDIARGGSGERPVGFDVEVFGNCACGARGVLVDEHGLVAHIVGDEPDYPLYGLRAPVTGGTIFDKYRGPSIPRASDESPRAPGRFATASEVREAIRFLHSLADAGRSCSLTLTVDPDMLEQIAGGLNGAEVTEFHEAERGFWLCANYLYRGCDLALLSGHYDTPRRRVEPLLPTPTPPPAPVDLNPGRLLE